MQPADYLCQKLVTLDRNLFQLIASVGPGSETFCCLPEQNKAGVYVSEATGGRTTPHVCPVQLKQHCGLSHFLPFLPFLLASVCLLAYSLFPWLADVRWKAARQLPLFKDSSVSSCLCRWQIHPSKMSTGREIFKEGRARGQRLLLFSLSPFFVSWAALAVLVSRADESACFFSLRNNVCGLRGFNHAAIIMYLAYIKRTLLQQ